MKEPVDYVCRETESLPLKRRQSRHRAFDEGSGRRRSPQGRTVHWNTFPPNAKRRDFR